MKRGRVSQRLLQEFEQEGYYWLFKLGNLPQWWRQRAHMPASATAVVNVNLLLLMLEEIALNSNVVGPWAAWPCQKSSWAVGSLITCLESHNAIAAIVRSMPTYCWYWLMSCFFQKQLVYNFFEGLALRFQSKYTMHSQLISRVDLQSEGLINAAAQSSSRSIWL